MLTEILSSTSYNFNTFRKANSHARANNTRFSALSCHVYNGAYRFLSNFSLQLHYAGLCSFVRLFARRCIIDLSGILKLLTRRAIVIIFLMVFAQYRTNSLCDISTDPVTNLIRRWHYCYYYFVGKRRGGVFFITQRQT